MLVKGATGHNIRKYVFVKDTMALKPKPFYHIDLFLPYPVVTEINCTEFPVQIVLSSVRLK